VILHRMLPAARFAAPLVGLALLASCGDNERGRPAAPAPPAAAPMPAPTPTPAPPPTSGASPNASEAAPSGEAMGDLDHNPLGVFVGSLPCSDCEAVETELTLYLEPDRFELKETRAGGSGDAKTRTSQGTWTTLNGTPSDANATVVQLDPDKPETARSFLEVGGDRLELLDRNLNALDARQPHALVRKADQQEEGR